MGACYIGDWLWLQAKLKKTVVGLKLPAVLLKNQGFGRHYVSTALRVLEHAGLVQVKRFGHKSPEVTLIVDEVTARKLRGGVSYGDHKTDAI
jgi:hypothetical protein